MRRIQLVLPILGLSFLASCRRNDAVQTYRVSREEAPASPMAMAGNPSMTMPAAGDTMMPPMAPAASPREIEWKTPSGWIEQPPSAMRVGSFLIKGAGGQPVDVSIVPLSGPAGGDLANINRWRGQLSLGPITEADLPQMSQTITPGGRRMLWVDIVSQDNLIDNRYKKRLMAAVYTRGEQSWFFKMTGEDAAVRAAKPAFLEFLQHLRFNAS